MVRIKLSSKPLSQIQSDTQRWVMKYKNIGPILKTNLFKIDKINLLFI